MLQYLVCFSGVVAVVLLVIWILGERLSHVEVRCRDPFASYLVLRNYADFQRAGCTLDELNGKAFRLLRYLKNNFETYTETQKEAIRRLLQNYNPEVMIEVAPTSSDTSYMIDKGRKLAMCLRDHRGVIMNQSLLTFVLLHEMSHAANKGWGHSRVDYWPIFKFILGEARAAGVHNPVDYSRHPTMYAHLEVNWSPYFDATIAAV